MGNREEAERLYRAHGDGVTRFFLRRMLRRSEAVDLCQEVFARLMKLPDLGAIKDSRFYVYRVAANLWNEWRQSASGQAHYTEVSVEDVMKRPELVLEAFVGEGIDNEALTRKLHQVSGQLPTRQREVLKMTYEQNLSQREIAERWGVSKTTVVNTLAAAIASCRHLMAKEGVG